MRKLMFGFTVTIAMLFATACGSAAPVTTSEAVSPTATAVISPQPDPILPSDAVEATAAEAAGLTVFRIIPDQSEARFLIDEILAGSPKTVVGVTTAVSGEISGEFGSPQQVVVGPILVDLSTLVTDNNFRNRAIRDAILQTGIESNRFASFQLTGIDGLPAEVVLGTAYDLSLSGDLTIHGVTRPVTFAAVVTPVSETRLEGSASVLLPIRDFDIEILRLPPQVASVGEVVTLEIDFVAEAG
jgi:polyisoprenoid-binding protein YceI